MGSWGSSARCYHRHPLDTVQDPRELIEAYYSAGWTDGLPVVPPSDASIEEMLAAAGLRGDEVIGEIPGRNTVVVADKVAINAVMAGCLRNTCPSSSPRSRASGTPTSRITGPPAARAAPPLCSSSTDRARGRSRS